MNNYFSMKTNMHHDFYDRIDDELNVPKDHRIWPDINNIDGLDRMVDELGGVDTVFAGIGYRGLVAFCEAPNSPYYSITVEEYAQSKTRIVHLNEDTLIALSERDIGSFVQVVPPMAVTIGFKAMLSAKRAVFMVTTGSWKRAVVRVLMLVSLLWNTLQHCSLNTYRMSSFLLTQTLQPHQFVREYLRR